MERTVPLIDQEMRMLPSSYLHILDIMRDVAAGRDVSYRADEAQAVVETMEPAAERWISNDQDE